MEQGLSAEKAPRDHGPELFDLYIRDIIKIPLLTADQEITLGQQIEQGHLARAEIEMERQEPLHEDREAALQTAMEVGRSAVQQMVEANQRLVVSIAKKYPKSLAILDRVQYGNEGLIAAAEKFDWRRGLRFSTFATWHIRGAISKGITKDNRTIRMPQHVYDSLRRLDQKSQEFCSRLGRHATHQELADQLELSVAEIEELQDVRQRTKPLSLDRPHGDEDKTTLLNEKETNQDSHTEIERVESEVWLEEFDKELRNILSEREYTIFKLCVFHDETYREVGMRLGVKKQRIHQIHSAAIQKLKEHPIIDTLLRNLDIAS